MSSEDLEGRLIDGDTAPDGRPIRDLMPAVTDAKLKMMYREGRRRKNETGPEDPIYENPRFEIFAQNYVKALVQGCKLRDAGPEAVRLAGYNGDIQKRRERAHRFLKNDRIAARIRYLLKRSADATILQLARRKAVLEAIATHHIGQFVPQINEHVKENPEAALAIESVDIDPKSDKIVRIRMRNAIQAIQELNKLEGAYPPEQVNINNNSTVSFRFEFVTPDQTKPIDAEEVNTKKIPLQPLTGASKGVNDNSQEKTHA